MFATIICPMIKSRSLTPGRRVRDRIPPLVDRVILYLLIAFCLFAPHSITLSQVAVYAAVVLWLIKIMLVRKREGGPSGLDLPLIALVVLTGLSAVFSYEPAVSLKKLGGVSLCLIFFVVGDQVRTVGLARKLVIVMLASCLVNVGYVFWQKVHGRGLRIVRLKSESPLARAGLAPGDVILEVNGQAVDSLQEIVQLARRSGRTDVTCFVYRPEIYFRRGVDVGASPSITGLGVDVARWHRMRASGFYGWNYFTYAEVLQLLAAIAFGLLLQVRRKRSWLFISLVLVVAAMGLAIILTVTRGVWVAFAGALLVMSFRVANKRAVVIVLLAGAVVAPVALKILEQTRGQPLLSLQEPSTAYRLTVWSEGLKLLVKQPRHLVVGIGMDSLKYHWREWGLFRGGELPVGHMHSTPLQIGLERGLPALICFVWWFAVYLALLWRLTGKGGASLDWASRGVCLGILGGTVGFLLSSLVHYNFGDSEVVMIVYFLMAVSIIMDRGIKRQAVTVTSRPG